MSIRAKLRHLTEHATRQPSTPESPRPSTGEGDATLNLARYKYLLRVASPEVVEQLHREAFAALDLEQRERVFLRLRHDLAENQQPASSQPVDLARAAVAAHQTDHGYLVRMLRRPGQGVTEGHAMGATGALTDIALFSGSVVGPVTATIAAASSASEVLARFEVSPEAAQVDPALFADPRTGTPSRHRQAALGGHDMGDGLNGGFRKP